MLRLLSLSWPLFIKLLRTLMHSVDMFSFPSGICLRGQLLGHMITMLNLKEPPDCFSKVAALFHTPASNVSEGNFFTSWPTSVNIYPFMIWSDSYANTVNMVSCYGFDLHFAAGLWSCTSFHVCICCVYIFFGEVPIHILLIFN